MCVQMEFELINTMCGMMLTSPWPHILNTTISAVLSTCVQAENDENNTKEEETFDVMSLFAGWLFCFLTMPFTSPCLFCLGLYNIYTIKIKKIHKLYTSSTTCLPQVRFLTLSWYIGSVSASHIRIRTMLPWCYFIEHPFYYSTNRKA